jgi:hypothetical protein
MIGLNSSMISEILKRQADLEIMIGQDVGNMRFFFIITTGHQNAFRTLFTSESLYRNEVEVLKGVREFFETVNHFGEHGPSDCGLFKHLLGLVEKPVLDESTYFSLGLIEMILDDLKQFRVAKTQKWFSGKKIEWDEVVV